MIVICDKCNTKYKLDDTLITEDGVKVRCSKCGNTFIVKKPKIEDIQRIEQSRPDTGSFQYKSDNEPDIHSNLDKVINETISNITTNQPPKIDAGSEFDWSALTESRESQPKDESPSLPPFELESSSQEVEAGKTEDKPSEETLSKKPAMETKPGSMLDYKEPSIASPTIEHVVKESIKQSRANYISDTVLPFMKKTGIVLFILMILSAGGIFGYMYRSQLIKVANAIYMELAKYISSNKQINIGVAVSDSTGYFLKNIRGQQLFVIEGKVTNITDHPVSFIKLSADIADSSNNVISTKTFYAGNILTDEELRTYTSDQINSVLNNEMGQSLKNFNLPPKAAIPFMVVFFDVPENLSSFTVIPKSVHPGVQ